MDLVGLRFGVVLSLVNESDVRTDWLSDIGATTTDDVSGLVVFWFRRALRVAVMVSTAFQSSTLSSVSARLWIVALEAQCWLAFSGGRRAVAV